jgi:hypothetical protein
VSVVLQGLEKMCDDFEVWMAKKSGLLFRVQDDLTSRQRTVLRSHMEQLRSELRRITGEMEVDVKNQSPRRAILAVLVSNITNLEETSSTRLRGYGLLPEDSAQKLDAEMFRLIAILDQMMKAIEEG